jgi:hypothetical protein
MGVRALEQSGRKITRKATVVEERVTGGRRRGMGSTSSRATLFIGGSTESTCYGSFRRTTSPLGFKWALFREVREKIKADFSPIDYSYDLNLCLGRQPNKKTTRGHSDGKHVLQAHTSH